MATIPMLQIPGYGSGAPTIDFSPLGDLGKVYREAQNRLTLADLGAGLADGSINFQQAAGKLASTGNLNGVVSLLQLGEAQRKREAELAAGQQFGQSLSSLYGGGQASGAPTASSGDPRGIRNNNPLNLEASPFTQRQPGFSGSDGRFGQFGSMDQGFAAADNLLQSYAQRGINTIGGVIGRWAPANDGNPVSAYAQFVARKVGVDPNAPIDMSDPGVRQRVLGAMAEFENGRPVQVASAGGGALPANAQPAQGVLPQAPQGGGLSPRALGLMRALSNPNLPAGQRDMASKLLAVELEQLKQPNDIKQYRYAVGQGYRGSFLDFQKELRRSGATIVDTGTIPAGYRAVRDADGRVIAVEPLPGSKDARAVADADRKTAAAGEQKERYADVVTTDIDRAIKAIDGGFLPTTGLFGDKLKDVGGTGAHDLNALLTTIRANIGFDRLQALRDASPTGGALGQVSDFENRQLQATLGNLEQSQSAKQLKENLNRVFNTYLDIIHGPGNGPARRPVGGATSSQPARSAAPKRVNDEAAYRALPSGTRFVAPDGSVRIKP